MSNMENPNPGTIGFYQSARPQQVTAHYTIGTINVAARTLREVRKDWEGGEASQYSINLAFAALVNALLETAPHVTEVRSIYAYQDPISERAIHDLALTFASHAGKRKGDAEI